ncbi:MAG: membrane protein insertion efficiency factor YidD [Alistipes indistinctus]
MQSEKSSKRLWHAVKWLLIAPFVLLIKIYQNGISPFLPPSCRYTPTCSQYCLRGITQTRPVQRGYLGIKRLPSCHPWAAAAVTPCPNKEYNSGMRDIPTSSPPQNHPQHCFTGTGR